MNKFYTISVVLTALTLTACEQLSAPGKGSADDSPQITLETKGERLSYAIGDSMGENLKGDFVPLDVQAFSEGMARAFEGRESLLSDEELTAEMTAFAKESYERAKKEHEALGEANLLSGAKFLLVNAQKEGVVSLKSSVQYRVLQAGDGPIPGENDTVEVQYRGTLLDGNEFDSTYSRGESATFGVNQVITGWAEALQLMPVGSKWEIVIPPEHAYGEKGAGESIGPWETLIFQVELLNIVNTETKSEAGQAEAG